MAYRRAGPVIGSTIVPYQSLSVPAPVAGIPDLPSAFPTTLDSPLAWTGSQFATTKSYIHVLSAHELQEIQDALESFKALGLDGDLVSRTNFPLPSLGPKLGGMRRDVYDGRGFAVIRGIDPKKLSVEDLTMVYLGLQAYIANRAGRQDGKGNMLVHIIADNSTKLKAQHHRHSTAPITFHNEEAGDVISWLTRNTAASGGRCIIASGYTVYNILAATRPDLVRALARSDWPFALPRFQCRPVFFFHEGRLILNFGRASLLGGASHVRPAHLPKPTAIQVKALDAIEEIARATQLEITTQPGDIHFINNLAIMHRREGFANGNDHTHRRHLVRMRLRDDELGWAIPAALEDEWTKAFGRTGSRVWHLEPMPDGFFPLRTLPN